MTFLMKWCWLVSMYASVQKATAIMESEDLPSSSCSNEDIKCVLRDITRDCFGTKIPDTWDAYYDQTLDCTSIRKALSILPSCEKNCFGFSWRDCYERQKLACTTGQYCQKHCKCTGKKVMAKKDTSYGSRTTQPPTSQHTSQHTTHADNPETAGTNRCPRCDTQCEGTISVGMAGVLFVFGLLIGALVATVMCVCLPCCYKTSANIRNKMSTRLPDMKYSTGSQNGTNTQTSTMTMQEVPTPAANIATATAPAPPQPRAGYQVLTLPHGNRDSHEYTGLHPVSHDQGEIYTEPIGVPGTYEAAPNGPIRGGRSVQSPIYNQFNESDIVPSNMTTGASSDTDGEMPSGMYHELDHESDNNTAHSYGTITGETPANQLQHSQQNGRIGKRSSSEEMANHNYFTLEPESVDNTGNKQAASSDHTEDGHQYFTLEDPNGTADNGAIGNGIRSREKTPVKHDYFVLEKTN